MARIRSIKPDFWKSEAIAVHSFRARLTFIGLWTYVDDNGVGLDNPKLVAAELFALEDDPREALANVREDLARLHEAGRIRRYTVDSKAYLAIVNWREHQKIDKPGKPRYPEPDDPSAIHAEAVSRENAQAPKPVAEPSREPLDTLAESPCLEQGAGSRDKGIREQGVPPTAERSNALAITTPPETTDALVGEWIEHCRSRPPGAVIGQVGKQVKAMLTEHIDAAHIRRGLVAWHAKSLHPSALPSVVNEVMNAPTGRAGGRKPSTTDERVNAALALAAQYDAQEVA